MCIYLCINVSVYIESSRLIYIYIYIYIYIIKCKNNTLTYD